MIEDETLLDPEPGLSRRKLLAGAAAASAAGALAQVPGALGAAPASGAKTKKRAVNERVFDWLESHARPISP